MQREAVRLHPAGESEPLGRIFAEPTVQRVPRVSGATERDPAGDLVEDEPARLRQNPERVEQFHGGVGHRAAERERGGNHGRRRRPAAGPGRIGGKTSVGATHEREARMSEGEGNQAVPMRAARKKIAQIVSEFGARGGQHGHPVTRHAQTANERAPTFERQVVEGDPIPGRDVDRPGDERARERPAECDADERRRERSPEPGSVTSGRARDRGS